MRTRFTVALLGTALTLLLAPAAALAYPQDPQAAPVVKDCEGSTGLIVVLHPGVGRAFWDITADEVTAGRDYLVSEISLDFYVNDVYSHTSDRSWGNRVGQGEPIRCTFTETWTFPNGDAGRIEGVSFHTLK